MLRMLSVASFAPWYHADTMLSRISAPSVRTQNMLVITFTLGSSGTPPTLRSEDEGVPSAPILRCREEPSSAASAVSRSEQFKYLR